MPVLATSFPDETHTYRLATAYDAIDNVTAKSQAATFASPSLPYPHPILFEPTRSQRPNMGSLAIGHCEERCSHSEEQL